MRAGKGEAYSYPDSQYYETLDVTRAAAAGRGERHRHPLRAGTAPPRAIPPAPRGRSPSCRCSTPTARPSSSYTDGTWRVLKANWLPGTQRDLEGDVVDYVENIDGLHAPARMGPPRLRRPGLAARDRARPGRRRRRGPTSCRCAPASSKSRSHAVSLTRLSNGAVVADFGKVYAAVPTVTFAHGVARPAHHHARRLPPRHPPERRRRGPGVHDPRHPAHEHELLLHRAGAAARPSSPSTTSASGTSRSTTPARPSPPATSWR